MHHIHKLKRIIAANQNPHPGLSGCQRGPSAPVETTPARPSDGPNAVEMSARLTNWPARQAVRSELMKLMVNNREVQVDADPSTPILWALRDTSA